jgi:hypothetical protein
MLSTTTDTTAADGQREAVVLVEPPFVDSDSRPDFGWMDAATRAVTWEL